MCCAKIYFQPFHATNVGQASLNILHGGNCIHIAVGAAVDVVVASLPPAAQWIPTRK